MRSTLTRRSARDIAGAVCANIWDAEQAQSGRSSAKRMSPFRVRSATTSARPTAARPCIDASALNAAPRFSAKLKSARRSPSFARERSTTPIWRRRRRSFGLSLRQNGRASTPICPRSKDSLRHESLTALLVGNEEAIAILIVTIRNLWYKFVLAESGSATDEAIECAPERRAFAQPSDANRGWRRIFLFFRLATH